MATFSSRSCELVSALFSEQAQLKTLISKNKKYEINFTFPREQLCSFRHFIVRAHTCRFVCLCGCMCVWVHLSKDSHAETIQRSAVGFLLLFPTYFWECLSLDLELTISPVLSGIGLSLHPTPWVTDSFSHAGYLHPCKGSELGSLCLQAKHVTHQTIFPVSLLIFFKPLCLGGTGLECWL